MDKHTPPQEALDSLDEIDRSLHQMLMLAELSASDGDMNRTNLQTVLEYLQRKIDCAADRTLNGQRKRLPGKREAFYLTRWTRMGMFCRLQLSITCFVPRDVPSQRATTRSA